MARRSTSTPPTLELRPTAAVGVRRGHPWVFRDGLRGEAPALETGTVVILQSEGTTLGFGVYDAQSPLAVRVWGDEAPTPEVVGARVGAAVRMRARLGVHGSPSLPTDAFRLVHGEGDFAPGFVADRYGSVVVLKFDGAAAETLFARAREDVVRALRSAVEEEFGVHVDAVVLRRSAKGHAPELEVLHGDFEKAAPLGKCTVREYGVPFIVDVARGQKTGAFLDQRENRLRVGGLATGRRVLNLFSYAGGFSLHAAHGGAAHVTSVDVATSAHATAQASFRAAGLDPKASSFVTADAFTFLEQAERDRRTWDLIVSDPPSFAPSERTVDRALAAYRSLHAACVRVLTDDGIFCAASCSSHVDPRRFLSTLDAECLGTRDLRLAEFRGPPADHPTLAAFPEGQYLKFAVLTR